jgi:hypothetical protein
MGTIINIMKINSFISANHFFAVEKLDNGLNGCSFKLNENIFTVGLIKINFFTPYGYIYLMIEVRLKIGECWYIARALLNFGAERNFIV